jgi:hypothetical protein
MKTSVDVTVECGKIYCWCACGRSKNQPFCETVRIKEPRFPHRDTKPPSPERGIFAHVSRLERLPSAMGRFIFVLPTKAV